MGSIVPVLMRLAVRMIEVADGLGRTFLRRSMGSVLACLAALGLVDARVPSGSWRRWRSWRGRHCRCRVSLVSGS